MTGIFEIGCEAECDECGADCGIGTPRAAYACETCDISGTWCENCVPGEEGEPCPECSDE